MNMALENHQIPLLADHHNHLSFYALLFDSPNLQHETQKEAALDILRHLDPQRVTVVLGWHSGHYELTLRDLQDMPPVIVVNLSLHRFLISAAAETRLRPHYPEIIANYQDSRWFEAHMPQMLTFLCCQIEPTPTRYRVFLEFMLRQGVYHVEEMQLPGDAAYRVLRSAGLLERTALWTTPEIYPHLGSESRAMVRGIKLFTDGAVGARSAALKHPYLDGTTGSLLHTDAQLYDTLRHVSMAEKSTAIHAIGDIATQQVVRVIATLKTHSYKFPEVRLEHCQFIDEETAREARNLGITLSMQPNFNSDSLLYQDRLPTYYCENNNPFRMLIDEIGYIPGENLLLGSDGMPHGAAAALQEALFPPNAGQRLNLREFQDGYGMPFLRFGAIRFQTDPHTRTVRVLEISF